MSESAEIVTLAVPHRVAESRPVNAPGPTVLAALTAGVLDAARAIGLDTDALRTRAGIASDALLDPDGRIPLERHFALWQALSEAPVGLELGAKLGLEGMGVLGYALQHGASVGHALEWLQRYRAVVHPDVVPRLEKRTEGEHAVVAFVQVVPAAFARLREPVDAQAAALVTAMQTLTGKRVHPLRISLPHTASDAGQRHAALFACPIQWGAPALEVVFDASLLSLELPRTDARIFGYLARRVEELSQRIGKERASELARRAVEAALAEGEPKLAQIARALGLSERTLHRRLQDEGISFTTLVDDARRARALLLLEDKQLSTGEIAFLLGYAEPSAFFRAFRRWTGDTPRAFRERMAAS